MWGIVDAIGRPQRLWAQIGMSKARWIASLPATVALGVGFVVAAFYFRCVRARLSAAEILSAVALWGDEMLAVAP